ncbi:MAG: hypothetical protein A2W03_12780 [Candidatus Aminicenantes bacterium RBG_16_63_16]|nr:MAG: hypothetical protein A2W03_12780 [Candidatus Aminicenantes bacterium RBG_16_63_16]
MAKIMLVDFSEADFRHVLARNFEVEAGETHWDMPETPTVEPPGDCRVVLYQANQGEAGAGPQAANGARFEKLVGQGGAVVCFIGHCQERHLTGLVGPIPHLRFQENKLPDKIHEFEDSPFSAIFTKFRPFISHAAELFPTPNSLGKSIDLTEWDPPADARLEVLAESFKNYPVSAVLRRGEGFYLFLPWFGDKNVEVAELLLGKILPLVSPKLFEAGDPGWLGSRDYVFPRLLEVYQQMEEESERHQQRVAGLEQKLQELAAGEQAAFHKLLTAHGPELREAVVRALRYLDYVKVVNVDEYWKRVIRAKEEDIWLMDADSGSVEEMIRSGHLTLVALRSGEGGAADDDGLLLQRYKGRRMQEFNNTRMQAVLIGNYFSAADPKLREVPFTESQIADATQDGNSLLTTYELFKAIKAEKEGKITKEAIREQLRSKTGLITFEY